jgi:hypothetical protein
MQTNRLPSWLRFNRTLNISKVACFANSLYHGFKGVKRNPCRKRPGKEHCSVIVRASFFTCAVNLIYLYFIQLLNRIISSGKIA